MKYWRSLRAQLTLVFSLLFAMILALSLVSVWSLGDSNEVATDVRDRWLPNTRLVGDLNNFTSDYRTAEADSLLAATPAEIAENLRAIELLDQAVSGARTAYERIRHNPRETALYQRFGVTWDAYRAIAGQVTALSSSGHTGEAAALYRTLSRTNYDAASDLLGLLTEENVAEAARASERSVRAFERARWLMGGGLAAAGLILTILISHVTRRVSHPLLDLGLAMRQLAANDTGIEVGHTERTDEIGEMARAVVVFRANAIDLAQSQRGLAQQATMLQEKLAHEQYVTQLQRNFVSMVTHEFRTPLTQIDAQAQRLINARERLNGDDLMERASRIRGAVSRIIRLIDNLVDSSRVMDGDARLFFHPEPIDLADVLRDACLVQREISPDALILEDFHQQPLPVTGDPKLLSQAFSNLLSNAIKYSLAGPKVRLRARRDQTAISVVVEDEGIGIPKQDQPLVFTRYFRAGNVSGYVGSGIGLFLAETVLLLHGGAISVESAEGKGSRFAVTLPLGTMPMTAGAAAEVVTAVTGESGESGEVAGPAAPGSTTLDSVGAPPA